MVKNQAPADGTGWLCDSGVVGGAAIFLAVYYGYFWRRIDRETLVALEGLRNGLGLGARVFYGGIVEEVLTRWGLLSIFVWLFWQYGLAAAMLAHMIFHLLWYPFDVYYLKKA